MVLAFPRRERPAAKVGPRLEISPLELKEYLVNQHGLSQLLMATESWEPFAWKGNDLSAPLRALYAAEARGLLSRRGDRAVDVAIADVAAEVNAYLTSFGKAPITENSILNNLRTASQYVAAAVGVSIIPDRRQMTIRFVDHYETVENIQRYFNQMESKLSKLGNQLQHAQACGFDVSHVLENVQLKTNLLIASSEVAA
jgi:hypothetical protein